MNIKRVIHYQLFDLGKAFLIYYFIILSIILLGGGVVIISSGNATFNGTGFSSTVFCFIAGLLTGSADSFGSDPDIFNHHHLLQRRIPDCGPILPLQ